MNSVEPSRTGSWHGAAHRARAGRVLRAGGRALRMAPWPADPRTAQLTIVGGESAPTAAALQAALREIAAAGYRAVVTAALGPAERAPFAEAGFEPLAWLHLLQHDLRSIPAGPTEPVELRRVRRSDWPVVAAVDDRAFPAFWHLGVSGIAEARQATPSNRVRVAVEADGSVVGYAIFGRSGTRGFLQRLAVAPDAQGHGIGPALVVDGLRWLRSRGVNGVLVNTQIDNERALALYLRLGFRLQNERLAVMGRPVGLPS